MNEQSEIFLYEFDTFRIDALKRQLLRDGKPVQLTSKAFETLLMLVRHRGATVSKDDLMNSIWSDTAVEENNLTQQISTLRKALGERVGEHRFIVTVPGRGYSFIAPVRENAGGETSEIVLQEFTQSSITIDVCDDAKENKSLNKSFKFSALYRAFALAAALLILTAAAIWFYPRSKPLSSNSAPKTIAVLPFKSLNADGNDEFLGTGMSDTLIAKLGNLQNLAVRPTNSVIKYANENRDAIAAGRELKVDAVLDGTVQRSGEQIRVTVQMLDVESGRILWGQSFDSKFSDIFSVQDAISEEVAGALQLKLSSEEQKEIRAHSTENIEAYQAYLRGRYLWNKRSEQSLNKAIGYFEQAIKFDPNYALAYAGVADSYLVLNYYDMSDLAYEETLRRAKQAVLKALELNDSLAEAHTSLAFINCSFERDAQAADREFRRAIELNPNYATAHHWYSDFLAMELRGEEAMREIKIAVSLDPVSPIISTTLGERLYYERQYDEAIVHLRRIIEMDEGFFAAHFILGMVYEQKGMLDEAIAEFQKVRSLTRGQTEFEAMLGHAFAISGNKREAEKILGEIIKRGAYPQTIALIYVGLGDNKRAIEWLKKMDGKKSRWFMKNDPRFDVLRSNPEFQLLSGV
jgi:TolB-like protein/DNA-binding winged helix-turn-helix (wHTH) protein/Tfp pilus assembly protein PilF